jgi:hypothetical protein
VRADIATPQATASLAAETEELVRIFTASLLTAKGKRPKPPEPKHPESEV